MFTCPNIHTVGFDSLNEVKCLLDSSRLLQVTIFSLQVILCGDILRLCKYPLLQIFTY